MGSVFSSLISYFQTVPAETTRPSQSPSSQDKPITTPATATATATAAVVIDYSNYPFSDLKRQEIEWEREGGPFVISTISHSDGSGECAIETKIDKMVAGTTLSHFTFNLMFDDIPAQAVGHNEFLFTTPHSGHTMLVKQGSEPEICWNERPMAVIPPSSASRSTGVAGYGDVANRGTGTVQNVVTGHQTIQGGMTFTKDGRIVYGGGGGMTFE